MRRLLAALVVALGVFAYHADAHAACTTHTIIGPNGRMVMCTTCCYMGSCTTNCF